jgi:hypothetical protein
MNLLRGIRSANNRMPHYIPKLFDVVKQEFDKAMLGKIPVEGKVSTAAEYTTNVDSHAGYCEIPLYSLMRTITLRINTLFLIGEEAGTKSRMFFHRLLTEMLVANDSKFTETAMTYTNRALVTAELCRLVPAWGKEYVTASPHAQLV